MATPTFKYPDTSAPTSTLEFTRGGFLQDTRVPTANCIVDESEDGDPQQMDLGDDKFNQTFTVQVPIATQAGNTADITKLDTFIRTTVNWAANPFYFTNADGTSYQVKCMNTALDYKPYPNYREYVLHLREV